MSGAELRSRERAIAAFVDLRCSAFGGAARVPDHPPAEVRAAFLQRFPGVPVDVLLPAWATWLEAARVLTRGRFW